MDATFWQKAPTAAKRFLYDLYCDILDGGEVADGFNDGLLAFVVEKAKPGDVRTSVRAPDELRTISMSTTKMRLQLSPSLLQATVTSGAEALLEAARA